MAGIMGLNIGLLLAVFDVPSAKEPRRLIV
jgi:hypothetical protein